MPDSEAAMLASLQRSFLQLLSPGGRRARLLILTYHRVLAEPDPLMPSEPDAALFGAQMQWLQSNCVVLPLPEAAAKLREGCLPARAACVTFDDGYDNNHSVAAPILRRLGLPATFFIAVEPVRCGVMWNDLLIEAMRHAPHDLDLRSLGFPALVLDSVTARRQAIYKIRDELKYQPLEERWRIASACYQIAAQRPQPRLMMTPETVADMARQGFDVGSHTVNHPILAKLGADAARTEIRESSMIVGQWTGVRPRSFAYPNGRPGRDYDSTHARMVEEAGFEVAVSTAWGCAQRGAHPFELPRIAPTERTASKFYQRLCKTYVASYIERKPARHQEYV